jgi:hypothetical protein
MSEMAGVWVGGGSGCLRRRQRLRAMAMLAACKAAASARKAAAVKVATFIARIAYADAMTCP